MAFFESNKLVNVYRKSGYSLVGAPTLALVYSGLRAALLSNQDQVKQTPVRTSESASHGHADYDTGLLTMQFPAGTIIFDDDIVQMDDGCSRVVSVTRVADLDMVPQLVRVLLQTTDTPALPALPLIPTKA